MGRYFTPPPFNAAGLTSYLTARVDFKTFITQ
jgi:hypothetical protein